MNIEEILTAKGKVPVTVRPNETMTALAELLRKNHVGAAVVSEDGERIAGVITERDIAYGLATHGAELHALPVSALMTEKVVTCSPLEPVARVASTMLSRRIRHMPVEKDGRLLGMLSIRDILKETGRRTAAERSAPAQPRQQARAPAAGSGVDRPTRDPSLISHDLRFER